MQVPPVMRPFLAIAHLSWPTQAMLICLAFLLMGTVVIDDYGAGVDTYGQRGIADGNLAFIMGDTDRLDRFGIKHDKYYGIAFELPLLLLERGLGLEDFRSIFLMRHLVTHGFFLVGGLCCSLLVYRLSHSRLVAAFALLVFVMQPRLYAHSFFNSKDLPFLSMFMVTLYVTHRAFRKETVGAFVLCGVCVGILTNLRIMGVMVYPAVLVLRGLDLGQARRGERTHVLLTGTVFAVAGPGTLYALSPYLWADPLEFVTACQVLAHHPNETRELFQGRVVEPHQLPWHYLPTWMVISTPLVTLLGGVLGGLRVCLRSVRRTGEAVGNTDLRFGLLLVACLILPVLTIITLGIHLFNGWRHVFFLHAPLCCLAGVGVQWAGGMSRQATAGVCALAGLGMLVTGGEMVRIHPHQQVYFNALVDRTTPEYLRTHYLLDPWRNSCREGLEFLRRRYPATTIHVSYRRVKMDLSTLPQADRGWLMPAPHTIADVHVSCGQALQEKKIRSLENVMYVRKVYNNTLFRVTARVTVPDRNRSVLHRAENTYRGATAGQLLAKGMFDIYTYPGTRLLGYARRSCTLPDTRPWFFLHIVPVDEQELPTPRRQYGFDNRDFAFQRRGKQVAGQCWTTVELPAYEIARIRTGQYNEQGRLWETELGGPLP